MKIKLTLADIAVCAVLLITAVLTIVGVCVNYIGLSITLLGSTSSTGYALGNDMLTGGDGYGVMAAFAYITLALAVITMITFIVYKVMCRKILKTSLLVFSVSLAICAIVAIITAFTFGGGESGALGSYSVAPAVGAWLLAAGGILGGATGIYAALKL